MWIYVCALQARLPPLATVRGGATAWLAPAALMQQTNAHEGQQWQRYMHWESMD